MENQVLKVIDNVSELIKDKKIFDIFPNSTLEIIKPALIDAFMLGFSLDDFSKKDVYILEGTLENKYNIVVSIDYARKTAIKNGLINLGQPLYEYNSDKKLFGCNMNIIREYNGEAVITKSRVILSDYDKGTGLWVSKPFVMLSKVCEMSAYRKAFPDIMSKWYISEEFDKELITNVDKYKEKLEKSGTIKELQYVWSRLPYQVKNSQILKDLKDNLKTKLS